MKRSIYFNYAGVAPISFKLWLRLVQFLSHFCFIGPRSALLKYEKFIPLLSQELAILLNCESKEITYLKNTSEGVIIAAESLPLNPGDEVLIIGHEYPANILPWLKKRSDGLDVKVIHGDDSENTFLNLIKAISERTKAISISWVQFYDGFTSDIAHLSEVCAKKGIFLVVDAVQIVGTRAVDLSKIKLDILICGGHKHLMATMGSGFIYVNKNTLLRLKPFKVGIRGMESFSSEAFKLKQSAARLEDGTPNLLGIVGLYYQIKWINKVGMGFIEKKSLELLTHYKNVLTDHQIKFLHFKSQGNMISIPTQNPSQMMNQLENHRIYVKAINNEVIRVAFSFLSSKNDIQAFAKLYTKYRIQ